MEDTNFVIVRARAFQMFLESTPDGRHRYTLQMMCHALNAEFELTGGEVVQPDSVMTWARQGGWTSRFHEIVEQSALQTLQDTKNLSIAEGFLEMTSNAKALDFQRNETLKNKLYHILSERLDLEPEAFKGKDLVALYKMLQDLNQNYFKEKKVKQPTHIHFSFGMEDNYSNEIAKEEESYIDVGVNHDSDSPDENQ